MISELSEASNCQNVNKVYHFGLLWYTEAHNGGGMRMPTKTQVKRRQKRVKKVHYNKLICNLIPKRLDRKKLKYEVRPAKDDDEFDLVLRKKIIEEAREAKKAKTKGRLTEELADLVRAINTLARHHRISAEELIKAYNKNTRHKGSLDKRTILMWVQNDGYKRRNK